MNSPVRISRGIKRVLFVPAILIFSYPILARGLDPHHDGLVLNIINQTRNSILSDAELPFNQYGVFWSFLMAIVTWLVDPSYTLLVARIITLGLYFGAILLLHRICSLIQLPQVWPMVLIIVMLTQPWTAGRVSTFLPWPSALSLFLLTAVTLQVLKLEYSKNQRIRVLLTGTLVSFLFFSRLQIGTITLFTCMVIFLTLRKYRAMFGLLLGFTFSSFVIVFLLALKGWL